MNTQNNPQDVEKIIRDLPDFEMRKRKEIAFFAKLFGRHVGRGLASFSILFLNLLTPMKRIITFAVLVIFAVGIVTAFSLSPGVTRGHFLYPLKRAEEQLEFLLSVQSLSKVKTHLDFANRRLEEVKVLMGEKPATSFVDAAYAQDEGAAPAESTESAPAESGSAESSVDAGAVVETVEEVVSETEAAMEEAEAISDPAEAVEALGEISQAQEVQSDTLQDLAETAPEEVAPALEEAVVNTEADQSSVVEAQAAVEDAVENGETEVQIALETSEEEEECDEDEDEDECKKAEKLEEMKEDAEEELAEAQEEIAEAKAKLAELGVSEEDAAKLLSRLDAKLLAAQEALAAGNYGKARGLSRAAQALTNNVKSYEHRKDFLKKKDKGEDEDEEEGAEDEENGEEAAPPSEGEGEGEEAAPPAEGEDEETEVEEDDGEGRPESPGRSAEHIPAEGESEGEGE